MSLPDTLTIDDTELQQLGVALEYSEGFALYFVQCNVPSYYQPLTDRLRAKCSKPIYTFTVPRSLNTLLDVWLAEQIQVENLPDHAIIFLYGLETLLSTNEPGDDAKILRHNLLQQLNWQRSAYQRLQRSLVIWLPHYAMNLMARYASDFYDWRTAVFEFSPPKDQRLEAIQDSLLDFERGKVNKSVDGLTLAEKQRWLRVLKGLIAEAQTAETNSERLILAKLLTDEANLYQSLADYAQAKPLYEEALKIREQVLGKQHPDYAESLNNLAGLCYYQGDYEQAKPLLEQALAIREQVLGKQHPDYAESLNGLAVLCHSTGQYERALPLYQRALEIREQMLGKDHPATATGFNNLAGLYYSQGDYEKALPLYQEALAIVTKVLGEKHPTTQIVKRNYQRLLKKMKPR
jgi:tetratricopeptide (TPR) repeat protein